MVLGTGAARTGVVAFEGQGARGRLGMWIRMGMVGAVVAYIDGRVQEIWMYG